uniref:Centromere protein U n=1 Tax=Propithecus coquereli TaxID=379532 RepID=A0A2K6GQ72_PROCO
MAPRRRVRVPGRAGARYSKNTLGRTHSVKDKTGQKHKPSDVFEFPDDSDSSSIGRLGENEKDEEPYETFDPPLHSTAIYADEEEFSKHCGLSIPSGPPGKEARRSLNTSESEASENESVKIRAKEKTQEKGKTSHGTREKSRSETADSDTSNLVNIWHLEGKKTSDIMELDIVLPTFEKTLLEYKQRIKSKICKEAVNKFYFNVKEELIKMLKDARMLKNLKRKNAKMISGIEKKRQRLIEVQDELLRLEPQLKQLQTKYDELKERKSSLKNAAYFLSNLKQLYRDYSDVQEKEPQVKET